MNSNPIKQYKEETRKNHRVKDSFLVPHTLCHVSGCCLSATWDPCTQSTDEIEFGESKFMDSPLSPTCIKDAAVRQKLFKIIHKSSKYAQVIILRPCMTISARTSPLSPRLAHV
jgi:hypothetical protein